MQYKFDNFMRFLIWIQGIIGIFFMYKCISYPKINVFLCLIAGVTIVSIILCSALLLTNCLNDFYYDIAELDSSINKLNSSIEKKNENI